MVSSRIACICKRQPQTLPAGLTRSMHLPKFNKAASRTTIILTSSLVTSLLRPHPCSKYLITPALISGPWTRKLRVSFCSYKGNATRAAPCRYRAPPPKQLKSALSMREVGSCPVGRTYSRCQSNVLCVVALISRLTRFVPQPLSCSLEEGLALLREDSIDQAGER